MCLLCVLSWMISKWSYYDMKTKPKTQLAIMALMMCQTHVPQAPAERRKGEQVRRLKAAPKMQPGRPRIGRNDPCPCGSGKKFKACHLDRAVNN